MTAKKINTAAAGMYAHHVARERRWIAAFNTSLGVIDGSVQTSTKICPRIAPLRDHQ
jgi:hypothetical protein